MVPVVLDIMAEGPWAGWTRYIDPTEGGFLAVIGPSYSRVDGEGRATVVVETHPRHRNRLGALHGGFIASVADHCNFAALNAMGRPELLAGLTIDLTLQFLGTGRVGMPLVCTVEILHETGRMIFVRTLFTQEGAPVASATATLRKPSPAKG